jgi:hypothetical protein
MMSRRAAVSGALSSAAALCAGCRATSAAPTGSPLMKDKALMKIAIEVAGQRLNATLFDNPSARDFATFLPLDLTLQDFASVEKIAYLPRKLTTEGSAPFDGEAIGDIAYYVPWGNIIFYYGAYQYAPSLIRLGRLDGDIAPLVRNERFPIRITALR